MKKLKRILGCALALIFFIETSVSPVVAVRDVPQGEFVVSEEAVQAASEAKEPSVEETSEEMAVTAEPPEETAAQKEEVSAEKAELTEEAAAEILTADTETAVTEKAVEAAVAEEGEIAIKEAAAEKADDTALGADAGDNVPKIHYATASTYKIYEGEAPDPAADEPLVNGVLNWLPEGNILTLIPEEGCSITEVTVTDENGLIVAAASSIVEKEPAAEDEGSAEEPAEESAEESNEESAEEGSGTVTASADMETGIYTLKFSDHGEDFSGNFTVSVKAGKDCVYVGELVGPKTEQDTRDGSLNYPWKFMEDAYSDVRDGGIIYVAGTANVTSGTREGWPDIQKDVTIKGYPAVLRGGTAPAAPTLNITVSSVLCGDTVFAGYDPDEDGTIHDPMYGDIVTAYPLNITGNGNIYPDSHRLQVGRLRADTAAEEGTEPETRLVPLNDVTVGSSICFNISPKESGTEEKPAKVDVHLYGTTALNLTHDAGSVLYESIAIERVGGTLNDCHPTSVEYKDRGLLPVLKAGSGDVNFTAKDLTGGDFYLLSGTEAAEFNVNMTLENCKGSPKLGNLNTTGEVLVSVKDSSFSSFYTTYNSLTAKKVTCDLVGSSIGELRHYGPSFDNWTNLSRGYQSFTDGVVFNMTDSTITTLYEATTTEGTDFTKPSVTVNLRSTEGKNCSFGNIYSNTGDRWKFNLLEGAAALGNGRFITADVEAKAGTALTMGNQSRLAALHDVTLEDNATLKFVGAEYWISGDLTGGTLENSTLEVPKRFDLGVKGNIGGSIRTKITGVTGTAGDGSTGVLVNVGASSVAGFLTYGGSVGDEGLAALGSASSRTYISASQVPGARSDAIYVRFSGSDTNDGTSYENAAATTKRAYELAAATGRNFIVVCGNVPYYFDGTGYGDYTWEMFGGAENAGSVTITSSHGTNYRSDFFKGMLSPAGVRGGSSTEVMTNAYGEDAVTTFKDINFNYYNNTDSAWSQTTSFFANGHRTVLDTGVSISLGTNLYAGANGVDLPHGTDLTVNSGSYNNIYGGSNGAKRIEGDAVLTVNSCSVSSQIIGGGVNGTNTITGNVLLTVNGVSLSGGNNAYRIYGTNSDNVTGDVTVKVGCGTGKVTGFSCLRGACSGKAGGDVTVEVNGDNTSFRTSAASDSCVDAIIANEATLTGKVDLYVHGGKGDPRLAIIAGGKGTIRVEDVKSVGSIMGYFSGSTADSPVDITVTSDLVKESGAAEQTVVYRGIYAGAGDVNSSRQAVSDSAGSVPAAGKKIASAGTVTLNNVEATVVCGGMNGWRYPVADITDRNLILSGTNRISTSLRQFTGVSLSRLDGQPVTELSYSGTQLECADLLNKGILTFTQGAAVTGNYTGAENAALRVAAEPVTFTKKLGGHTALEPVIPASGCQVISLPYAAGDVPEGKETFQAVGITFATGVPEGGATWEVRPRLFPRRKNVFVRDSLGESEPYPYDEHDGSDYDHAVRSLAEAFVLADTETDGEANIIVCGELSQENNWNATENSGTVNITGVYVATSSTYDYRKDGAALHLTGSTGGFLTMNGNWTVKNLPIVYDAKADLGIDADGHTLIFGTDICPDIVVDKTEGARRYVNGRWETVDAPVPAQAADVTVKTSTGGAPTRFYIIGGGRTNKNPQNIDIRLYNTKVGRVIGMYSGSTVGSQTTPGSFNMVLRDTEICGFSTYSGTYPAASLCATVGIANNVRGGTGTINGDARCDLEVYSKASGTLPMLTHTYSVTCTGNGIKAHVNKTKAAAPTSIQYDGFAKCSGDYYELYDGLDNGSYGFSSAYYTMEDYTRTCPENVTLTMLGGFRITSGLFWKYAYEHATEDRRNPVSAETTDLTVNFGNAERGSFVTVSQFLYNYSSSASLMSRSNNPSPFHSVNVNVYPGTKLGGSSTTNFALDNYTFSPYANESYAAKDVTHGYPNIIFHGNGNEEEPYTYTLNTFRKFAVTADDCVVKIGDPSYICSYAAAVNNGVIDFGGKKLTIGKSAAGYGGDLILKDGGSVTNYLKTQTAEVAGTVTVDNATLLCDAEKLSFGKYTAAGDAKMLVDSNTTVSIGDLSEGCGNTTVDYIPEANPAPGEPGATVTVQRGLKPEEHFVSGFNKKGEGTELSPLNYSTKDDEYIGSPRLPVGYTEVEYLTSGGEVYIDMGVYPTIDTKVKVKTTVNSSTSGALFGSRKDPNHSNVTMVIFAGYDSMKNCPGFDYQFVSSQSHKVSCDSSMAGNPITIELSKEGFYIDGERIGSTLSTGFGLSTFSMTLFAINTNETISQGRQMIHECNVYEKGRLIRNFVPCCHMVNGTKVYGMYDLAEGRFYGNVSGKGAFTGGPEVSCIIPGYSTWRLGGGAMGQKFIVYLKDSGSNTASGGSISDAVKTLGRAFEEADLRYNGNSADASLNLDDTDRASKPAFYITVCDNYTLASLEEAYSAYYSHPKYDVIFTSENINSSKQVVKIDKTSVDLPADMTIRSLRFRSSVASSEIYFGGHTVTVGAQVFTNNSKSGKISLYAGANTATVASTNLTVESGSWWRVYGGGNTGAVTGDTNLILGPESGCIPPHDESRLPDDDDLVRDFVPCRNENTGEYGMFDIVEGVFYGDVSGRSGFTGGDPVNVGRYAIVEYIESHGAEYIDTDVIPDNMTGIKTRFSQSLLGGNFVSGCVKISGGKWSNRFYPWYLTENAIFYGYEGYYGCSYSVRKNEIYEGTLNYYNDKKAIFEGKLIAALPSEYTSSGYSIYLFATNAGTSVEEHHPGCRVYDVKVTQDQEPERDFVPVLDTQTGEYGMYDKVEGKFYGNASGQGAFTGGELTGEYVDGGDYYAYSPLVIGGQLADSEAKQDDSVTGVIGGGCTGTVGGNVNITVRRGDKYGYIAGGGVKSTATVAGNTTITVNGGATAQRIYGGGLHGAVSGNTRLDLNECTTDRVYGGGLYAESGVGGSTAVNLSAPGTAAEPIKVKINQYARGSGAKSGVAGTSVLNIYDGAWLPENCDVCAGGYTGEANISRLNIEGGLIETDVFAGSAGEYKYNQQQEIIGVDTTVGKIGYSYLTMSGGTVTGNVFGGGNKGCVGVENTTTAEDAAPRTTVTLTGGTVTGNVYGGCSVAATWGNIAVNVPDGSAAAVTGKMFAGGRGNTSLNLVAKVEGVANITVSGGTVQGDDESSIESGIYGGCDAIGTVKKSVVTAETAQKCSIFGGGCGAQTGVTNAGLILNADAGTSEFAVYGGGELGTAGTTKVTAEKWNGTIYGGGKGAVEGETVTDAAAGETAVTVTGSVTGNVYGGGEMASVKTGIGVTVSGTVNGNVYGGGKGLTEAECAAAPSTDVTIEGTVNGTVYGGGELASVGTEGSTADVTCVTVAAAGTVTGDVYGGGMGAAGTPKAIIKGNTGVVLNGTVGGSAFGGGKIAPVAENTCVTAKEGCKVNAVYGGNDVEGSIDGKTQVMVLGGTVGEVYGGGRDAAYAGTGTDVDITGGTVSDAYAGGRGAGATVNIADICVTGGTVKTVYGGGNAATVTGSATVTVNTTDAAQHVERVFGGNNQADMEIQPAFVLTDGKIGELYCGGNEGLMTKADGLAFTFDYPNIEVGALYAGCSNTGAKSTYDADTTLTMKTGTYGDVYGGNNVSGAMAQTGVTVAEPAEGGLTITNVYGGGNVALAPVTNVVIDSYSRKEGKPVTVYGGGNQAVAQKASVTVNGGSPDTVYAGGNEGSCNEAVLSLKGGDILTVYGGGNAATVTEKTTVTANADSGKTLTVADFYCGNNQAAMNIQPAVTLEDVKITSFYGGGNQGEMTYPTGLSYTFGSGKTEIETVYGGGDQAGVTNGVTLTVEAGGINTVYGGSNQTGDVSRTTVNVKNDIKGSVYGGGRGSNTKVVDAAVNVTGGTIGTQDGSGVQGGSVYGGSGFGSVKETRVNVQDTDGKVTVLGSVYGAGYGLSSHAETTSVNVDLALAIATGNTSGSNIGSTESCDLLVKETAAAGSNEDGESEVSAERKSTFADRSYINGNVYGGGDMGQVGVGYINTGNDTATVETKGTTRVTVKSGYVNGSVFGGGNGQPTGVDEQGNPNTYTSYMGAVFGTCSMNVEGGCVNGSVYGCGLQSKTYADYGSADHTAARVTVSTVPTENTKAIVIGGSIFGGGNKGNGDSLNASIPTVYGDTNVEVSGTENSYTHIYMLSNAGTNQGGGIYGDGSLCLVSGNRHVLLQNFSCGVGKDAKLLKTFYSLQRANEVDMISSRVVLKGAIDLVDEHPSDDRYSVNRVGEIHMKQNSTMKVVQLVNQLGGLTSDQDLDRKFIWLGKNTNNAGNGNELLDNGYTAHGALATDPGAPISPAEVTAYRTAYENYADHGSTESTQFTSINTVCVANGGYLEIMKGENEYGNVNGLFTLQLLKAVPGEGGGFVYADITESTGNFVCVTKAAPVEGQEDQYMFVYHNVGGKVTGEKLEYYYWYLKGGKYGYSVDLKGVLGTTETTFDSKVALAMDQAPASDPAKDFSSYYYVLSKLSMGSVTELQKNYMYRILRNGWDEASDADSEHLAIELVTTRNSRTSEGMVTETKSIGYLGYKTVGGTPQGEADETSGAREWGLWVKSSESPAVWTFLPSHHGQTDYTFKGNNTIPLDLIELNCVSATLTFVMHKGTGVVEEFRDIPYNIEIVEAEKKTFDRGDVDMHADACTKVDIGLHVSVVRLVPTQAAYISAGRLYAGVPATTEFTATRDSAFTAQFITRYVPSSYNTASQNNITEMVVTRYNETYLLVTEGHLNGIGFTLAGDPGEGGLCTIKRVANAEDAASDHYTITYKTVAGAGKYEIRYNSGDSTKCQEKCHKASSDNELSVYGSDTSPLKGYRFIVKNFAEGDYEVTGVIKTETGVPKDVPAYYTITKDEGEGDSYTVHYDPSDVAEIPDDSETGGAHVKHLKDGFSLPRGTAVSLIISMDEGAPTYWYYYCDDAAQTTEIPLSKFNRMNRKDSETELQNENAAMAVRSAASTRITENLIFVFDFANVTDDDWTAAGYDKEAVKEMDGTVLLHHEFRPQGSGFSYDVMDFIQETKDETGSTFAHGTPAPSDPFRLKVRDAVQDFKVTLDRDTYYCHDTMQAKLMLNANTDVTNTRYDERTFAAKVSLRDESGNVVPFPEGTVITYKGAELSLEKKNLSVIVPIKVYGSHEITISNQMQGFEAGNFGLKAELYTTSADGYYNSIPIRNDVDTSAAFTVEEDLSTSLKVVTDEDVTGPDKRNHLRKPGQSIALNVTAVGGVPEDRVDVTLYTYVEAGSESGYVPVPLENVLTEKPELATGVNTWQSPVAETAGTGIYRLQFNYLDRTEYWDFLVY